MFLNLLNGAQWMGLREKGRYHHVGRLALGSTKHRGPTRIFQIKYVTYGISEKKHEVIGCREFLGLASLVLRPRCNLIYQVKNAPKYSQEFTAPRDASLHRELMAAPDPTNSSRPS